MNWLRRILKTDPESFKGKLYLLVFERVLLGLLIAAAFVAYDRYRESDVERFQQNMAQLNHRLEQENSASQQSLERVKLLGELIPLLRDPKADALTRAYVLRSAVRIGSIDADAAVELASNLFVTELTQDQFAQVMSVVVPDGISAISRQGVRLAGAWRKKQGTEFSPGIMFNPVNGVDHIPDDMTPDARNTLVAGRSWRRVMFDAVPKLDDARYQPLEDTQSVATNLYGLFVLMSPGDSFQAIDLSRRNCRAIRLIGNLDRVLLSGPKTGEDPEAVRQLSTELTLHLANLDNIRLARVLVAILAEYGPPSGPIAEVLARILSEEDVATGPAAEIRSAYYWLQFEAGELLARMQDTQSAGPILIKFVSRFQADVAKTNLSDEKAIEALSLRWEDGKLLRLAVECLGKMQSQTAKDKLFDFAVMDDRISQISHAFPFLVEDALRALARAQGRTK